MLTRYLWDYATNTCLAEMDEQGETLVDYTVDPQTGELISENHGGQEVYHRYDGDGNTRQTADSAGNVLGEATYDAFGETVAESGDMKTTYRFQGQRGFSTDPLTGDASKANQTYSPSLGRALGAGDSWMPRERYFPIRPGERLIVVAPHIYRESDVAKCHWYLWAGPLAEPVLPCAAELLRNFLDLGRTKKDPYCPRSCIAALNAVSDLPPAICLGPTLARQGSCNPITNDVITISGKVWFKSGDLFFGLKRASYWVTGGCTTRCAPPSGNCTCCLCHSGCYLRGSVRDIYDFCGTSSGPKYSVSNCGCVLQLAGLGTPFAVDCPISGKPWSGNFGRCMPTEAAQERHCPGTTIYRKGGVVTHALPKSKRNAPVQVD